MRKSVVNGMSVVVHGVNRTWLHHCHRRIDRGMNREKCRVRLLPDHSPEYALSVFARKQFKVVLRQLQMRLTLSKAICLAVL